MSKLLITILLLITSASMKGADTAGYVKISDLKAFSGHLSVYLENGLQHNCDTTNNTRFQSNKTNTHYTSFLLAAFTAGIGVNFKYTCDGVTALITGIRLQAEA